MSFLVVGVLLFAGVHLVSSGAPDVKVVWLNALGELGYKGSFSLLVLASIALMVYGWRSAEPFEVYMPILYLRQPGIAMMMFAAGLLVVSSRNSRIRQGVRHPQLTAVLIWALTHLAMNGDSRSVVLFSAMAIWSFVEILIISKREGDWVKADIPSVGSEVVTAVIIVVLITTLLYTHIYYTGIQVLY